MLKKNLKGNGFVDKKGRLVNELGYLIDMNGNVIDIRGKLMFEKIVLEKDGEIPAVFRTGLLQTDTASDVSRIQSEPDNQENQRDKDGETSLDSKMEDTPANYDAQNQRPPRDLPHDDEIPEDDEGGEHAGPQSEYDDEVDDQDEPNVAPKKIKKKPKKKKPKLSTIEFLQPTGREKSMAGAYGGQAIGSIRRPGIKYEKDRLEGSRKFRVSTADEPKVRAQLSNLVKSQAKLPPGDGTGSGGKDAVMNRTGFDENKSQRSASRLRQTQQSRADSIPKERKRGAGSKERKTGMKDGDFEQMFGKDID